MYKKYFYLMMAASVFATYNEVLKEMSNQYPKSGWFTNVSQLNELGVLGKDMPHRLVTILGPIYCYQDGITAEAFKSAYLDMIARADAGENQAFYTERFASLKAISEQMASQCEYIIQAHAEGVNSRTITLGLLNYLFDYAKQDAQKDTTGDVFPMAQRKDLEKYAALISTAKDDPRVTPDQKRSYILSSKPHSSSSNSGSFKLSVIKEDSDDKGCCSFFSCKSISCKEISCDLIPCKDISFGCEKRTTVREPVAINMTMIDSSEPVASAKEQSAQAKEQPAQAKEQPAQAEEGHQLTTVLRGFRRPKR